MDKLSEQYQKEIEEKYAENRDKLYKDYQAEKGSLNWKIWRKRERMRSLQSNSNQEELQMKYFGRDGLLFKNVKNL